MNPLPSTPSSLLINVDLKPPPANPARPHHHHLSSYFPPSEGAIYLQGSTSDILIDDELARFVRNENHFNDPLTVVPIPHDVGEQQGEREGGRGRGGTMTFINACISLPMVRSGDRGDMQAGFMMENHKKQPKHEGEAEHHHVDHSRKDRNGYGQPNEEEAEEDVEEEEEEEEEGDDDDDGDGDDAYDVEEEELEHEVVTHVGTPWACESESTLGVKVANATPSPYYPEPVSMVSNGDQGPSPIACLDCGNQAKKDCAHMRCRTCCKSKGLECPTHIKSTWVPAHKRRLRHQHDHHTMASTPKMETPGYVAAGDQYGAFHSPATITTPTAITTPTTTTSHEEFHGESSDEVIFGTRSHASAACNGTSPSLASHLPSWFQQDGGSIRNLPRETREHATFKCIKVTGMNDGIEEYAYQTVVTIGGHVYKGVLYDQGMDKIEVQGVGIPDLRLGERNNGEM